VDRRERMGDLTLLFQAALDGQQAGIWTALPGQYIGAGSKIGTANVQPTVQGRFLNQDGETWGPWQNLPPCQDCPIVFPGGGGAHLTFPLRSGDEGLIVFASRCIDNWWLQGGPQPPAMIRMHDLSDGFFIPGCFSQPNAPSAPWSTNTTRLTTDDGLCYVELTSGHIANVVAPGGIVLDGPVTVSGTLTTISGMVVDGGFTVSGSATVDGVLAVSGGATITGILTATGDITAGQGGADSVTLQNHIHHGVAPAGGGGFDTSAPTAGT
jgi:hypothetical protein